MFHEEWGWMEPRIIYQLTGRTRTLTSMLTGVLNKRNTVSVCRASRELKKEHMTYPSSQSC